MAWLVEERSMVLHHACGVGVLSACASVPHIVVSVLCTG